VEASSACPSQLAQAAGALAHGPLLRPTIDPDQPEPRPVAQLPLEVVEERPVQEAPHVDPVADRPAHAGDRALDIDHAAAVVVGREPALGRDQRPAAGHLPCPPQRGLERLGPELPAGPRQLEPVLVAKPARRADPVPGVRVDAHEVVAAGRLEEDVLPQAANGLERRLAARRGLPIRHRDGQPDRQVRESLPQRGDGPAVAVDHDLGHAQPCRAVPLPGWEDPLLIAQQGHDVGLVDRDRRGHAVAQGVGHPPAEAREALCGAGLLPAARVGDPARVREVVEGDERRQAVPPAGRHDVPVVRQPPLREAARPGLDA